MSVFLGLFFLTIRWDLMNATHKKYPALYDNTDYVILHLKNAFSHSAVEIAFIGYPFSGQSRVEPVIR